MKIRGCVSRGGIADEDAPLDPESTRYWATVGADAAEEDETEYESRTAVAVDARDAMAAIGQRSAGAVQHAPDVMAHLQSVGLASASLAAPAPPSTGQLVHSSHSATAVVFLFAEEVEDAPPSQRQSQRQLLELARRAR